VSEFVPGFEGSGWHGVCAPTNTPTEVVAKLNTEINAGLSDAKIKARIADWACLPLVFSPADFGKHFAGEIEKWAKVIQVANVKSD
jgi:tripartite-type tricarboxylate transporter receptor subunit TctC